MLLNAGSALWANAPSEKESKIWLKRTAGDEWIKKWYFISAYVHTHTCDGILSIHKKRNLAICSNMDGHCGPYAAWDEPDTRLPTLSPVWPRGPQHSRLLCPWDSPSRNTGVGCRFLLRGIFQTEEWSPPPLCLLHWQADSLPLASPGKPNKSDGGRQMLCALTCEILKNKERLDVENGSAISRGRGRREGAKCIKGQKAQIPS